jgi:hypothetical protein
MLGEQVQKQQVKQQGKGYESQQKNVRAAIQIHGSIGCGSAALRVRRLYMNSWHFYQQSL